MRSLEVCRQQNGRNTTGKQSEFTNWKATSGERGLSIDTILSGFEINDIGVQARISSAITLPPCSTCFVRGSEQHRIFRNQQDLLLENLALRQQLTTFKRRHPNRIVEEFGDHSSSIVRLFCPPVVRIQKHSGQCLLCRLPISLPSSRTLAG